MPSREVGEIGLHLRRERAHMLVDQARRTEDLAGGKRDPAADGVHCYLPDGTLIGKIHVPEVVANLCFGQLRRNRLYICGTTSLYAYYVLVRGAKTF